MHKTNFTLTLQNYKVFIAKLRKMIDLYGGAVDQGFYTGVKKLNDARRKFNLSYHYSGVEATQKDYITAGFGYRLSTFKGETTLFLEISRTQVVCFKMGTRMYITDRKITWMRIHESTYLTNKNGTFKSVKTYKGCLHEITAYGNIKKATQIKTRRDHDNDYLSGVLMDDLRHDMERDMENMFGMDMMNEF